jgi:hypothetical protein
MYKITANGKHNILLSDIGVRFSYPQSVVITEKQYNDSLQLKAFVQHGIVVVELIVDKDTKKNEDTINDSVEQTVFVKEGNPLYDNSGSFIKQVDENDEVETQKEENIKVENDVDLSLESNEVIVSSISELTVTEDSIVIEEREDSSVVVEEEVTFVDNEFVVVNDESIVSVDESKDDNSSKNNNTFSKRKFGRK